MSMQRILVATGAYAPEIGGPATHTALLERALPQHGIAVTVAAFRDVRHLPKVVRHIAYTVKVARQARTADLVFAQDTVSAGLPARIGAWLARRPFVVRVTGDYAWEQATQRYGVRDDLDTFQTRTYGLRTGMLRAAQRFTVRHAHGVIAPSEYLAGIARGWGARPRVVYNGISLPASVEPPAALPGRPLIVSAGRLVPWKGFDTLLAAARDEAWQVVCIGEGPDESRLRSLAEAHGIASRVHFTGRLPQEKLLGWCACADVFVLDSQYEGLSHTLLEVMSLGVPIVASNVGGNPELITDGAEGLLVPPDDSEALHDALQRVFSSADAHTWGEHAAKKARHFQVEKTTEKLVRILHTVCESYTTST